MARDDAVVSWLAATVRTLLRRIDALEADLKPKQFVFNASAASFAPKPLLKLDDLLPNQTGPVMPSCLPFTQVPMQDFEADGHCVDCDLSDLQAAQHIGLATGPAGIAVAYGASAVAGLDVQEVTANAADSVPLKVASCPSRVLGTSTRPLSRNPSPPTVGSSAPPSGTPSPASQKTPAAVERLESGLASGSSGIAVACEVSAAARLEAPEVTTSTADSDLCKVASCSTPVLCTSTRPLSRNPSPPTVGSSAGGAATVADVVAEGAQDGVQDYEQDEILEGLYWRHLSRRTTAALEGLDNIGDRACILLHGHIVAASLRSTRVAIPVAILSECAGQLIAKTWSRHSDLCLLLRADYDGLVAQFVENTVEVVEQVCAGDDEGGEGEDHDLARELRC
jgi:hypothetical protein